MVYSRVMDVRVKVMLLSMTGCENIPYLVEFGLIASEHVVRKASSGVEVRSLSVMSAIIADGEVAGCGGRSSVKTWCCVVSIIRVSSGKAQLKI